MNAEHGMVYLAPSARALALNSYSSRKKGSVLVLCGQHSRELVSSEVCAQLITDLVANGGDTEVLWWIVPVVNRWGRAKIMNSIASGSSEYECLRTNVQHIDLNRNFASPYCAAWQVHASMKSIGHEEYAGRQPYSAKETLDTLSILHFSNPDMLINVHSGAPEWILLPYDSKDAVYYLHGKMLPSTYDKMVEHVRFVQSVSLCQNCTVGRASVLLYDSVGTLADYYMNMQDIIEHKDPDGRCQYPKNYPIRESTDNEERIAYTLEVYNNDSQSCIDELNQGRCLCYFNPIDKKNLKDTTTHWSLVVQSLAKSLSITFVGK
jgi:hypothetical protein